VNRIPQDDDDSDVKIVFYHEIGGRISECDLIVCLDHEWDARPEASDPAWSVVRSRGKVYALAVLI
jgi:hypothetical protein